MTFRRAFAAAFVSLAFAAGCNPPVPNPGPPALQVGTGDGEFEALGAGATVPINYGSQGGEHIWFAARCRGLGPNVALTYSIVDDEGNVVSPEQQVAMPEDELDDEGWRVVSSLTAFIEGAAGDGTHVVFHGHVDDGAGHEIDATANAVVKGAGGDI